MADVRFALETAGGFVAERFAEQSKAIQILNAFVAATGGPVDGTNQQKADHVLQELQSFIVYTARDQMIGDQVDAATISAREQASALDWTPSA